MKKYFCLVMIIALIASLAACSVKVETSVEVTETSVVNVTDASGETVTDAQGEIETEVVTVPVTEVVTDKEGETVTKKDGTPVTEAVTEIVTKSVARNDKTEKNSKEAKSTTNWKDRYKNTTNAANNTEAGSTNADSKTNPSTTSKDQTTEAVSVTPENEEMEKADQAVLNIPFSDSVELDTDSSGYKAGDYTEALKKLINSKSYTMASTFSAEEVEGATMIVYVDGDRVAYHWTVDLSSLEGAEEIKAEDLEDLQNMPETSGVDLAALASLFNKNIKELKIHMIAKNGKYYIVLPQLNLFFESEKGEMGSQFEEQVDTILDAVELIESKKVDGMVRESYKSEEGSIIHFYYKDAMFSKMEVETDGQIDNEFKVKSVTKGVKNKAIIFAEPYAYQINVGNFSDLGG